MKKTNEGIERINNGTEDDPNNLGENERPRKQRKEKKPKKNKKDIRRTRLDDEGEFQKETGEENNGNGVSTKVSDSPKDGSLDVCQNPSKIHKTKKRKRERDVSLKKKKKKKDKEKKGTKKRSSQSKKDSADDYRSIGGHKQSDANEHKCKKPRLQNPNNDTKRYFPFEYQHILAPMVGASELPFRLLCRKYGATLAYTPMMSASQFVKEADELLSRENNGSINTSLLFQGNICNFQTIPQDRPLVVHFSANTPHHFAKAAKLVENICDAVDLNLGCPQRTAYLGHFGSYLLGIEDRKLVLDIVRAGSQAVSIPIFVKIRLLDTIEETIQLCHQLRDSGASLIAIHARYRASWERTGPGARDGPALLDQVAIVKQSMPDFPIISNGNVITYDDVVSNQKFTGADGIMSAEGILDNPSLYLPRLGNCETNGEDEIVLPMYSSLCEDEEESSTNIDKAREKMIRKLRKKLREIEFIETRVKKAGIESIGEDQRLKWQTKEKIEAELNDVEKMKCQFVRGGAIEPNSRSKTTDNTIKLHKLFGTAMDKVAIANEYLTLAQRYPTSIRTIVFHTRRMCKSLLEKYQLMEECIASTTIDEVQSVLAKITKYTQNPQTFHYDVEKARRDKEALIQKRREEGKRKAYEARMIRKAKREGLDDLEYYLRIGVEVPTVDIVRMLKKAPKQERLVVWKKDHSQHCMAYHLEDGGCKRDRACAFLHVDARDVNSFVEDDEVAG